MIGRVLISYFFLLLNGGIADQKFALKYKCFFLSIVVVYVSETSPIIQSKIKKILFFFPRNFIADNAHTIKG